MSNPKFYELQRLRKSTWDTPRFVRGYDITTNDQLALPRALRHDIGGIVDGAGSKLIVTDDRNPGQEIEVAFAGQLDNRQSVAVSALLAHDDEVLVRIMAAGADQQVVYLSGGNQQKVLLAKWFAQRPRLLIVDEPTKGVDVGARADIYEVLRDLAAHGIALLVVSSDLPEVLALAQRIVVLCEGRTVGELPGGTATEEDVLRLATRYTASVAPPTALAHAALVEA